jgi:hypothetical protein
MATRSARIASRTANKSGADFAALQLFYKKEGGRARLFRLFVFMMRDLFVPVLI